MKPIKVIKRANLPTSFPISTTIVGWLLMDRLHAPPLAWGVAYTLGAILWALAIYAVFNQEEVNVIERSGK